ncbi:MAG: response regulator transcription factor [Nitrospinaceae bacterium]|nr:response regulator transcription factor [Nitrospinaceae bacterium]
MKKANTGKIRVFIVEDHPLFRQGLRVFFSNDQATTVAGEAETGRELLEQMKTKSIDVVILDISLPDENGLDMIKEIKKCQPGIAILMLSAHPEKRYAVRAIKAGASGYLTKSSPPKAVMAAVQKVARGEHYISSRLVDELALSLKGESGSRPHDLLSNREFQIMCMLATGKTTSEIAEELCLSLSTIFTHRTHILEKMGLKNTPQLMFYASSHGLIDS